MSLVELDDVVVVLERRRVLDGLSLTVAAGEQLAVTGRSGSGKTTLLLVLAGLLSPTGGRATLSLPAREVAYVPQAPSLLPELSALENAALGLRLRGVRPAEALARAADELELLGLSQALAALPAELSGGMQQRVALARATVIRPRLLLTDEPTGSLDHSTGQHVLSVLRDLASTAGLTLIVATHDQEVMAGLPRQVLISEGRTAGVAA